MKVCIIFGVNYPPYTLSLAALTGPIADTAKTDSVESHDHQSNLILNMNIPSNKEQPKNFHKLQHV